jgi:hypothetical protein
MKNYSWMVAYKTVPSGIGRQVLLMKTTGKPVFLLVTSVNPSINLL